MTLRLVGFALALLATAGTARGEEIALQDMKGRSVSLPGPARRVVALPLPAAPTILSADRSADRLAGLHPTVRQIAGEGPLGRLFPALLGLDTAILQSGGAAFMPNVEALAVLSPDLVVQRGERGEDIVEPLLAAGLRTILVTYGDEAATRANIRLLARAVGAPERGEALVDWRDAVAERIRAAQSPEESRPGIVFLSRGPGGYSATGGSTPNDHAIAIAGGRNLAGGMAGSIAVTAEQLFLWDPDVILLNSGDEGLTPATLAADPVLSALSAVRTGRVYKAPLGGYRTEPPGPENPLLWLWLAAVVDPKSDASGLRTDIRDGFALVYGAGPTEDEIDTMLQLGPNRETAGYGRFARP